MLPTPLHGTCIMGQPILFFLILLVINNLWANSYHQSIQFSALRIGTKADGSSYFLCRAMLFNTLQPGKTWAGYNGCIIPYNGKEYVVSQFTVPTQSEFGRFIWSRPGLSKSRAIIIGHNTNGQPLYLCQSFFRGGIEPGKTWEGYNHCNITFAGHEVINDDYHILVTL